MENDSDKAVGYNGVLDLGRRIKRSMITAKLYKSFAKHTNFPYTDWWLDESTDPFNFVETTQEKNR